MSDNDMLLLSFRFVQDGILCECCTEKRATLREITGFLQDALFLQTKQRIHYSGNLMIEEPVSGCFADPDLPISEMKIRSGMYFIVY